MGVDQDHEFSVPVTVWVTVAADSPERAREALDRLDGSQLAVELEEADGPEGLRLSCFLETKDAEYNGTGEG